MQSLQSLGNVNNSRPTQHPPTHLGRNQFRRSDEENIVPGKIHDARTTKIIPSSVTHDIFGLGFAARTSTVSLRAPDRAPDPDALRFTSSDEIELPPLSSSTYSSELAIANIFPSSGPSLPSNVEDTSTYATEIISDSAKAEPDCEENIRGSAANTQLMATSTQFRTLDRQYTLGPRIGAGGFKEVFTVSYLGNKGGMKTRVFSKFNPIRPNEFMKAVEIDNEIRINNTLRAAQKGSSKLNRVACGYFIQPIDHTKGIITRLYSGGDVDKRIPSMNIWQRKAVALQMVQGIQQLHAEGLAHRDIKVDNFLTDHPLSDVRIADFGKSNYITDPSEKVSLGLAYRYTAPEVQKSYTNWTNATNRPLGEWNLMAPMTQEEKARMRLDCVKLSMDPKADVYSLGIALYQVLAGIETKDFELAPCQKLTAQEVQQLKANPGQWKGFSSMPQGYRQILLQMLNPNPIKRPTLEEVHSAIKAVQLPQLKVTRIVNDFTRRFYTRNLSIGHRLAHRDTVRRLMSLATRFNIKDSASMQAVVASNTKNQKKLLLQA